MKFKKVFAAVLAAAFLPLALKAQNPLSLDRVVERLDENFRKISAYQAGFKQEVKSEQFGKIISQGQGELKYLKPGRMVWHYTAPEEHWYITDGKLFWDYLPQTRQAMKLEIDQALASSLPKTFLFGLGKLDEQFDLAFSPDQEKSNPSVYHLVLTPKRDEDKIMIGTLSLLFDAKTFLVRRADLKDSMGNQNSLIFSGIKVNPKIDPGIFQFKPPEGVEVITAPAAGEAPAAGGTAAAEPSLEKPEPEEPKEQPGGTSAAKPGPEKSNDQKGAEPK